MEQELDFSGRPEGATHYIHNTNRNIAEYYKPCDYGWLFYNKGEWLLTRADFLFLLGRLNPLPQPSTEKEMDIKDKPLFPEVGTVCEIKYYQDADDKFEPMRVTAIGEKYFLATQLNNDNERCYDPAIWIIRPLKSERDKIIEAAITGLHIDMSQPFAANNFLASILGQLYDAGMLRMKEDE